MKIKQGIEKSKLNEVLEYCYHFFSHLMGKNDFLYYMKTIAKINLDISVLLLDNHEIKGVYILGNHQISSMLDIEEYRDLKGIEGVLLCVDQTKQGLGYGNQLKDYPKTLDYDYIWGQQFKGLDNLDDWLKRRELVGETDNVYITLERFIK